MMPLRSRFFSGWREKCSKNENHFVSKKQKTVTFCFPVLLIKAILLIAETAKVCATVTPSHTCVNDKYCCASIIFLRTNRLCLYKKVYFCSVAIPLRTPPAWQRGERDMTLRTMSGVGERGSPHFKKYKNRKHDTMRIINLSDGNSIMNKYMAEIRDTMYQKNRLLFRNNIQRIGQVMAYEMSKTLDYAPQMVTTPLGTLDINLPQNNMLIATVLRAGLPFHQGFLDVFDHADNAFVSAYRMYTNREHTQVGVHTEYLAAPSAEGRTLVIVDPMLATGGSMAASYEALVKSGTPRQVHIACVIATPEGIDVVRKAVPENTVLWAAAIDPGMNEHKYIVPGFGDCGDLCFGEKL